MKKAKEEKGLAKTAKKSRGNLIYGVSMSLVIIIFSITILHQYRIKLELDAEEAALQSEINKQTANKQALLEMQENQDSPDFIEKIARERLNMVKPNEIVFIDQNK